MFFDPLYYLLLIPALLLTIWAQAKIGLAFATGSRVQSPAGISGAEAAGAILRAEGVQGVQIALVHGELSDHYDARRRVLRLSNRVFAGRSAAALGIAVHEAGHAIQQASGYAPLIFRNLMVPAASLGSGVAWIVLIAGWGLGSVKLILLGMILYSALVAFQLLNLPAEVHASRRARKALVIAELADLEDRALADVLDWTAWRYVAATLSSPFTLLYSLVRSGIIGHRRDDVS